MYYDHIDILGSDDNSVSWGTVLSGDEILLNTQLKDNFNWRVQLLLKEIYNMPVNEWKNIWDHNEKNQCINMLKSMKD